MPLVVVVVGLLCSGGWHGGGGQWRALQSDKGMGRWWPRKQQQMVEAMGDEYRAVAVGACRQQHLDARVFLQKPASKKAQALIQLMARADGGRLLERLARKCVCL